jgi:CHAT domain-containing protein/tetratricopeptide (TPR) repeat protein
MQRLMEWHTNKTKIFFCRINHKKISIMKKLILILIVVAYALLVSAQDGLLTGTYKNSQGDKIVVGEFDGGLGIMVPGYSNFYALVEMADGWYANPFLGIICMADQNNNLLFGFTNTGTTDLYVRWDEKKQSAKSAVARGEKYASQGNYCDAAEQFEKAYKYEQKSDMPDPGGLRYMSSNAGINYSSCGNYDKTIEWTLNTIEYLEEDHEDNTSPEVQNALANAYYTMAEVYMNNADDKENVESALEYAEKGLEFINSLSDFEMEPYYLVNFNMILGLIYSNVKNDYKAALEYYEEAESNADYLEGDQYDDFIYSILIAKSMIYGLMGDFQKSLIYSQQMVDLQRDRNDNPSALIFSLTQLGSCYSRMGNLSEYKKCIEEAGQIANSLDNSEENMDLKYGIIRDKADILLLENKLDESEALYVDMYNYYKNIASSGRNVNMNMRSAINGIYRVYMVRKDYPYCQNAILESMKYESGLTTGKEGEINDLYDLANVYLLMNKPQDAAKYLEPVIALEEALITDLPEEKLRGYLNQRYYTYQLLSQAYIMSGRPKDAMKVVEIGTGKGLLSKISSSGYSYVDIDKYTAGLPVNKIIIRFPYFNSQSGSIGKIAISNAGITGIDTKTDSIWQEITDRLSNKIAQQSANNATSRGFKKIIIENQTTPDSTRWNKNNPQKIDLGSVLYYYSSLLSNPSTIRTATTGQPVKKEDMSDFEFLSRALYSLFFSDLEPALKGKKDLVIIPDGMFAFITFETLMNSDRKMLGEMYSVTYSQSLAISNEINKRQYASPGKTLAMGGAIYKTKDVQNEQITYSVNEKNRIINEMVQAVERDEDLTKIYDTYIAPAGWNPLPGTLSEIKNIAAIDPLNTTLIQSELLTKNNLFDKSSSGELSKYRILHFATHGFVVWSVPELSSLVLSPNANSDNDCVLNLNEILKLKINAQIVTLSACETAMGYAFMGEGVNGLPQAFIQAGAQNVIASLWCIDDQGTNKFMTELYKNILVAKQPVSKALALTKQEFISGKFGTAYQSPFYWSPFVCYGSASDHYTQLDKAQGYDLFTDASYTLPEPMPSADDFYTSGVEKYNQNDFDGAIVDFSDYIELKPENMGFYARAICYLNLNEIERALSDLSRSLRENPTHVESLQARAYIYEQLKRFQDAVTDYDRIIALQPDSAANYINQAKILYKLKQYDDVIVCMNKSLKLKPDDAYSYYVLANTQQKKGNTNGAIANYTKVIQYAPDAPDGYFQRAMLNNKYHGLSAAIDDFKKVIELEDASGEFIMKPYVLQYTGKPEEALSLAQKLAEEKNDISNYYNLASIYSLQNDSKNAVSALSKAIDKGFNEFDQILEDEDLNNIRNSTEFKELLVTYGIK